MTAEGTFPKVDGDVLFSSEVNRIDGYIVYIGDGFDTTQSGTGTDTDYYETSTIDSLTNSTYIIIEITQQSYAFSNNDANDYGQTTLAIATKEVGGAYGDSMASKVIHRCANEYSGSDAARSSYCTSTIKWMHTLTAGEKTNGCVVKITSTSVADGTSSAASLTNIQTTFKRW